MTLEIEAEVPAGAPDHVVRTVTENSRTLKFTSQGFEKRISCGRRLDDIAPAEDHVLIVDLGPADQVDPHVESLSKDLCSTGPAGHDG